MKEIRIELRAKNNRLWKEINNRNQSIKGFCKDHEIDSIGVYNLVNLRKSPLTLKGNFTKLSNRLSEIIGQIPEWLFPEELYQKLTKKMKVIEFSMNEARALGYKNQKQDPIKFIECKEKSSLIEKVLCTLREREAFIIRERFGLNGGPPKSLQKIGEELNLNRERIRQIECRALRVLRHPERSRELREVSD